MLRHTYAILLGHMKVPDLLSVFHADKVVQWILHNWSTWPLFFNEEVDAS